MNWHKSKQFLSLFLGSYLAKKYANPKVKLVTINPAVNTPKNIDNTATLFRIPKINAIIDPDQAPVIGKGIDTKRASPQNPYF